MPDTSRLDPDFRFYADALVRFAKFLDPRFVITSARRSRGDQQRLYNQWKKGDSPFPAAAPGRSWHEYGLALDVARRGVDPQGDEVLARLGRLWVKAGGVWGGTKDPVHFQAPRSWTGLVKRR